MMQSSGGLRKWTMNINCTFQSSGNIYPKKWKESCARNEGTSFVSCTAGHKYKEQGSQEPKIEKAENGAPYSFAVLKSAVRIPKASMASVAVINSMKRSESGGLLPKRCNYVLFIFIYRILFTSSLRPQQHRVSPGNFTDLSLINFRKLFALSRSVDPFALGKWSVGKPWSRQWKLINIINHKIKYHLY